MRRSPAAAVAVLIVIALVAIWGFSTMIGERFSSGDGYPPYSTDRTDPQGAKALYDALARMPGATCERNFKKLDKLVGAAGKTLVLLHVKPESFSSSRDVEMGPLSVIKGIDGEAVKNFAAAGGRVVIALDGQTTHWDVIRRSAEERSEEVARKKREAREKKDAAKKGKEPKEKPGKEDTAPKPAEPKGGKADEEKKDAKAKEKPGEVKEIDPDLQDLLTMYSPAKSLRSVLGAKVLHREHVSGPELPPIPVVAPGSTLDPKSLPVWRSRATLLFEDYMDEWDFLRSVAQKLGEDEKKLADIIKQESGQPKKSSKDQWITHALAEGGVILAERRFSSGSVIVATDDSFTSNEGLARGAPPKFLAWLIGDAKHIIFDETHLGTKEDPGIMALVRKHNLHGLFVGGLILFGLFVWRSSMSLVPANDAEDDATRTVSGHGATAGLVSLLRRGISRGQVMTKCFETWEKTATRPHASMQSRIAAARGLLPPPKARRARKGVLTELYRQICEILHPRRN